MPQFVRRKIVSKKYLVEPILKPEIYFSKPRPTMEVIYDDLDKKKIRYFFEPSGLKLKRSLTYNQTILNFLKENEKFFGINIELLTKRRTRKSAALSVYRYSQYYCGLPVYRAYVTANIHKRKGLIFSLLNSYDFGLKNDIRKLKLEPTISKKEAKNKAIEFLMNGHKVVEAKTTRCYIYRYKKPKHIQNIPVIDEDEKDKLKIADGKLKSVYDEPKDRNLYVVWQVIAIALNPFIVSYEILVDAATGNIVSYYERINYRQATGNVFEPDPASASNNALGITNTLATLDPPANFFQSTVIRNLERLNDPVDGFFELKGAYCRVLDLPFHEIPLLPRIFPRYIPPYVGIPRIPDSGGIPHFPPTDFNQPENILFFFSTMAYYWIDTVQHYIQDFLEIENAGNYPIQIDPHGLPDWVENSCFLGGIVLDEPIEASNVRYLARVVNKLAKIFLFNCCCESDSRGMIILGTADNPNSADAGVILHEYAHAIQYNQSFPWSDASKAITEGFADIFSKLYLDRFIDCPPLRNEIFPFDNNPALIATYDDQRNVDVNQDFSVPNFEDLGAYIRADIWATTVWKMFLSFGGGSADRAERKWAADLMLKLYLESNVLFGSGDLRDLESMDQFRITATLLEEANIDMQGWNSVPYRICKKIINNKCAVRHLIDPLLMDVYIGEEHYREDNTLDDFYNCPDIIIRNRPSNPDGGHQQPVNGKNYIYVKIRRNSPDLGPNITQVYVYHKNNRLLTNWNRNFSEATPELNANLIDWQGNRQVWVGPFSFDYNDNEVSIVAIVVEPSDPAYVTGPLSDDIPLHRIVTFDNNIAQRNIGS